MTTPGLIMVNIMATCQPTTILDRLLHELSTTQAIARFSIGTPIPGYRLLDPVMCGPELMTGLYLEGSLGADLGLIVTNHGLFDARTTSGGSVEGTSPGSPAHVASLLRLPVVLIIDVHGMFQSVGAVVKGFTMMDPTVRIGGVMLIGTTSHAHEEICRHAVQAQGIPVLEDASDVAAVASQPAPGGSCGREQSMNRYRGDPVVAVSDAADPELGGLLSKSGAKVVLFNALVDPIPDCDGLIIVGDLAPGLDLGEYVATGKPLHVVGPAAWRLGELLELDINQGEYDPGVYRSAVSLEDSVMFSAGERVIGIDCAAAALPGATMEGWKPMWGWRNSEGHITREGFHRGAVSATCLRVHPAVVPGGIDRFVAACASA